MRENEMKFGLEQEFFLVDEKGEPVLVPVGSALPCDECGWLIEARGEPKNNIIDAVFSLKAEIYKIERKLTEWCIAKNVVLRLSNAPLVKLPVAVEKEAQRHYVKGLVKYDNLYGYSGHKNNRTEKTSGIHISFTHPKTTFYNVSGESRSITVNAMFDWYKVFKKLDLDFATEIKEAKRVGGMYEIKDDGRIEYRSLPSNTDHDKIISVVKSCFN